MTSLLGCCTIEKQAQIQWTLSWWHLPAKHFQQQSNLEVSQFLAAHAVKFIMCERNMKGKKMSSGNRERKRVTGKLTSSQKSLHPQQTAVSWGPFLALGKILCGPYFFLLQCDWGRVILARSNWFPFWLTFV